MSTDIVPQWPKWNERWLKSFLRFLGFKWIMQESVDGFSKSKYRIHIDPYANTFEKDNRLYMWFMDAIIQWLEVRAFANKLPFKFSKDIFPRRVETPGYRSRNTKDYQIDITYNTLPLPGMLTLTKYNWIEKVDVKSISLGEISMNDIGAHIDDIVLRIHQFCLWKLTESKIHITSMEVWNVLQLWNGEE